MTVRDRIGRAGLDAIAAENAARIIDIVNACVPLACRNAIRVGILSRLDINAIRRTRGGAQKAADALLQPIFIAMQNVNSAVAWLKMNRFVRVVLGDRLPKHILKGHAEALRQRRECFGDFANDRGHRRKV